MPALQLDGSGGVYNSGTESVDVPGDTFSLYALLNSTGGEVKGSFTDYQYFVSVAVVPKVGNDVTPFGSFGFDHSDYSIGNTTFGTPPLDDFFKDLPKHSIYPTRYIQKEITFSASNTAKEYNTMDNPGGFTTTGASADFLYVEIPVDISNLDDGYDLHFDLYALDSSKKIAFFAPFSHDAQSTGGGSHVPVGGTTGVLLGMGTFGLFAMRRGGLAH